MRLCCQEKACLTLLFLHFFCYGPARWTWDPLPGDPWLWSRWASLTFSHCRINSHWKWEPQHFPCFLFRVEGRKNDGKKGPDCLGLRSSSQLSHAAENLRMGCGMDERLGERRRTAEPSQQALHTWGGNKQSLYNWTHHLGNLPGETPNYKPSPLIRS